MGKNKKEKVSSAAEEIIKKTAEEPVQETDENLQTEQTDCEQAENEKLAALEEQLANLENQLAAKNDAYMRIAAEYDNFRKRTQAEKASIYEDATSRTILEILPISDSIELAVQNSQDAPEQFRKGLELVKNQFVSALAKLGIEPYGEIGDEFDPEIHNAVSRIESEELGTNEISQVFQKGYKSTDRVVRHAMVQVANCD